MSFSGLPNDPLFQYEWYLLNTGQSGGTPGIDIDVTPLWSQYTGKGVRVGVVDTGTQLNHPDLVANIDPNATWDAAHDQPGGNPMVSLDNHGTAVAGLIAATANNSIGGVGVAPGATLGVYYVDEGQNTSGVKTNQFAIALTHALNDKMDVVNASWGTRAPFVGSMSELQTLAEQGRHGLGTVIVMSSGDSRSFGSNAIMNATKSSQYVITVGAIYNTGIVANYSTPGASLLITAPGGSGMGPATGTPGPGLVTTDRTGSDGYNTLAGAAGDYVYNFSGTSGSTPIVSGVVALILEANPNLNYRDVQQILLQTARINDTGSSGWFQTHTSDWNGGGHFYNSDYGFGLVDARAAVRLAESYRGRSITGTEQTLTAAYQPTSPIDIAQGPDGTAPTQITFTIDNAISVEHVSLNLNMKVPDSGNLRAQLTSPDGTTATLLLNVPDMQNVPWAQGGFTLTSPLFWGEHAQGTWTLSILDNEHFSTPRTPDTLNNATLSVIGSQPSSHDIVYTNDFPTLAGQSASRLTLSSTQSKPIFNASAVSLAVNINIPKHFFSIGNTAASIDPATTLSAIYTGDGNDTLVGGNSAMVFNPGYGDNTVLLGATNNIVNSRGQDTITATQGAATVRASGNAMVFNNAAQLNFVSSAGASTVIGGTGAMNVNGGAGKITVFGGAGADTIIGGSAGGSQLTANGAGSAVFANGNGNVLLGSKTGAVTLATQGASNTVFGGAGGGTILSNGSHDLVVMDQGATTLFGGQNAAIFTNSANANIVGETGSYAVGFGSGTSNAWASASTDLFLFANGQAGGNVTIGNFQDGKDFIQLQGYGDNVVQNVLAGAQQTASGLSLTLSDNTHITLLGVTSINQYSFMT
ncbi:Peptidase S8 family protein [Granulibacter bethesdensis]|uniref:Peptidase S8 family protein n=1 Tax=Granulibacter bethesdensis TaxID=364410 RepID=A0AAC9KCP6_9PROT|nr:S8 family serine peptidase [Granulibacter bethesdensis]APH54913.1 Peptidase S8 family protein [Granulibacter bethesdensis]APH62499.1 Peptidase S8 family protein [Granulibacter bethesdensis]